MNTENAIDVVQREFMATANLQFLSLVGLFKG